MIVYKRKKMGNTNKDHVHCDNGSFLRWLFGINGFDEWQIGVSHNLKRKLLNNCVNKLMSL